MAFFQRKSEMSLERRQMNPSNDRLSLERL